MKQSQEEKKYKTSEELMGSSAFLNTRKSFNKAKFGSNKDRLEALLEMMEEVTGITEGLFRLRPSSSQVYALTNVVTQLQGLMSQLDQTYNFSALAHNIQTTVIDPIIERSLIDLSQMLSQLCRELDLDEGDKKLLKSKINENLKAYAVNVQSYRTEMESSILDILRGE